MEKKDKNKKYEMPTVSLVEMEPVKIIASSLDETATMDSTTRGDFD